MAQFKKGQSGNPAGRPKKQKDVHELSEADRAFLAECITNKNMDELLTFLVSRSKTVAEATKYIEKFGQYVLPKLSSKSVDVTEKKDLTVLVDNVPAYHSIQDVSKVVEAEIVDNDL